MVRYKLLDRNVGILRTYKYMLFNFGTDITPLIFLSLNWSNSTSTKINEIDTYWYDLIQQIRWTTWHRIWNIDTYVTSIEATKQRLCNCYNIFGFCNCKIDEDFVNVDATFSDMNVHCTSCKLFYKTVVNLWIQSL